MVHCFWHCSSLKVHHRFWNHLIRKDDDRLSKKILMWDIAQNKKCWAYEISTNLTFCVWFYIYMYTNSYSLAHFCLFKISSIFLSAIECPNIFLVFFIVSTFFFIHNKILTPMVFKLEGTITIEKSRHVLKLNT